VTTHARRAPGEAEPDARARVLALVRRFGWNTTSFQMLERGYTYRFFGDDACVAFVAAGAARVTAGAPVAPDERLAPVCEAFVAECRARRRRAVFFATEERFVARAASMDALLIGAQPIWDPRAWEGTVRAVRSLREQMRRARAKGVTIERHVPASLAEGTRHRAAIEALMDRWRRARPMAPMGFLVRLEPFGFADEHRYYAAYRDGALVGFLSLVPIYARGGFFFEDLLRDPAAPNVA
jgi:phosphatidylglycerol lysyltransferase